MRGHWSDDLVRPGSSRSPDLLGRELDLERRRATLSATEYAEALGRLAAQEALEAVGRRGPDVR